MLLIYLTAALIVLAFSYLAWCGVGRWLMGKAGIEDPPGRWWFWWRVWWAYIVAATVFSTIGDANLDPPSAAVMRVLWGGVLLTGVLLGLGLRDLS